MKTNDPRPPYLQVADDLREAIRSGQYEPGQRLPGGRELAKQYGVALMTLQICAASLTSSSPPRKTFGDLKIALPSLSVLSRREAARQPHTRGPRGPRGSVP